VAWGSSCRMVLIAAQAPVVYPERRVAPEVSLGAVCRPGVLVVSMAWELTLGAATAVHNARRVWLLPRLACVCDRDGMVSAVG
jgi:hypothetical protein